jgi:hypothetical protein
VAAMIRLLHEGISNDRTRQSRVCGIVKGVRGIAASFARLWNTQDHLRLHNIRAGHLQYMLAMPMGLGIANMMSSLFRVNEPLFGMDPKVTLYCAYLLGAILFLLVPSKRFLRFLRAASPALFHSAVESASHLDYNYVRRTG